MNGNAQKLIKYMDGASKRFIIPVYQRNYDWQMENCKQLFDDLVKVIKQGRKSHFFGSIVSVQDESGTMEEFLIIDGQQRLTTVSLLLLAIYRLLSEGKIVSDDKRLMEKILKKYLIDEYEPEEKRIKLKPIKNDQKAFGNLFDDEDDYIPDSNLTINYKYFYDRIQLEELTVDELFDAICKLEIISITLNHDDNPQLIFESLNSTGMDLSEGDKIRNYVLMGLDSSIQEKYYTKYWNRIEECTGYNVSDFMRDYLSVQQQSTPNIKAVYVSFKQYIEKKSYDSIEVFLKELLEYAKRYEILIKGNTNDDALNWCIYRLNRLGTTVTRPFLLEVLRLFDNGKINWNDVKSIFKITEDYLFRRIICDIPTNALNKIFLLLHREITRIDGTEENYLEKFKYVLISKKESAVYPTDEAFADAIEHKGIYQMNSKNRLYLFERLENHGTVETKAVWDHLDKGDYSIEHIMPQHLTASWIEKLGDEYERIHETWLHRLANLTLTAYNSKYSNRDFIEKRDMDNGFKKSGIRMNQWIGQQDKWTEAELVERNNILVQRALEIWEYPSTDYKAPEKLLDMVSLEDDAVLTGRNLAKYSFMGVETPVTSWADMYQQVITTLHKSNKSVMTHLAVVNDPNVELSSHFTRDENAIQTNRKIDDNLYIWTGIDTQYKQNVLRKLFSMFGIEENELIFYLRDEAQEAPAQGTRFEKRKKYWGYALPEMKAVFDGKGAFSNVSPTTNNWVSGFIGYGGINLCAVANTDGARVELYIGKSKKEDNKEIFDYLYSKKNEIEKQAGTDFNWARLDDNKASKIYLEQSGTNVFEELTWKKMCRFHSEGIKVMADAFVPLLKEYFDN